MIRVFVCLMLAAVPCWPAQHKPLLPQPREVRYGRGQLTLRGLRIRFASPPTSQDRFAAAELSKYLSAAAGTRIPVAESAAAGRAVVLTRTGTGPAVPGKDDRPGPDSREAYSLQVTTSGAEIRARSSAGLFYGVQTLRQLVEGAGPQAALPVVTIRDWPSLAYRGFMMDLSHGPLPTVKEIKRQIDFLARWKANQYYFYSEASIEVKGYPLVNLGARYSQQQVRDIIAYARQRHVDVVPTLELFGHMHDLFRIERYSQLSLLRYGGEFSTRNPQVQKVLEEWVKQMAELFPSPWFHIGCDETWALGKFKAPAAGGADPGKTYVEYLKNVIRMVRRHGKRVLFWADVLSGTRIFSRHPELISQLPPESIAVPWTYSAPDYEPYVAPLAKAGLPVVVASGIWCWNEVVPSFHRTFKNISGLLATGRKYGTLGLMNTGWTDDAQVLYRMALPGMAYGAVAAWQSTPVNSSQFFSDYARQMYPSAVAREVAPALEALTNSQELFARVLSGRTMHLFWDDPFAPARLKRARAHQKELRRARLSAEDGTAHLVAALQSGGDPASLSSLLLGARMLDYLGMKYLYAVQIAGYFDRLGPHPPRRQMSLLLRTQTSAQDHSLLADLMDSITELRRFYRKAWLMEYRPYRLGTALGRWDAEYQYWRSMQTRFQKVTGHLKPGEPLPPLDAFRPKR